MKHSHRGVRGPQTPEWALRQQVSPGLTAVQVALNLPGAPRCNGDLTAVIGQVRLEAARLHYCLPRLGYINDTDTGPGLPLNHSV